MKRIFNTLANFLSLHCRWAKQHQFLHNAMELPGIPDAKEPDGPEDGIVVLENNLGAAIEVTLDQEVKVLYPRKRWIFGITRASDKLMKVRYRDDPQHFWDSARRRRLDPWCNGEFRGLSAFRSQISCKRSSRRWSERSPCCRNGKGRWKRNLKKNAWGVCLFKSPLISPGQRCPWASWCYGRVWTPKTRTPQRSCAWHWCCRWLPCAFAAWLLGLLVPDVKVHDGKCWQLVQATAVSSWAPLLWP